MAMSSSSAGGIGNSQPAPDPNSKKPRWWSLRYDRPRLSYRQIAKAYQASLSSFETKLMGQGLSDAQATALRDQAIRNGSISSVQGAAQNAVDENKRQAAEEEHHAEMRAEARARAEVEWDRASTKKKAANFQKATQTDMTQAEKLAAYQQTATYKNYQAKMQAWGQEKKNEAKAAQADMTQAEKLAVYQQTDQYKNNQASLQAYERQKANEDFRKGERAPENVTVITQPESWVEKAWDGATTFMQQKIVQPVQNKVEEIKKDVRQQWESLKETSTVLSATFVNALTTFPETTKKKWDYYWNIDIKREQMHVPAAQLQWNPAFPDFQHYIQNQEIQDQNKRYILPTHDVECVTTSAVDVRNMINDYLANLTGKPRLPYLTLQKYINATDTEPGALTPVRFPTDQQPLLGILPIAGWMHPRFQLLGALQEYSNEFHNYYGYSFQVRQTSYNTLDDIANELQQGHPVIVSGMWEAQPNDPLAQRILGGWPHTMGSVVEINANTNKITIMDTNGDLNKMNVDEFLKWWGRPSIASAYTDTDTMTVIIPDKLPVVQPNTPTSTPLAIPAQTVPDSATGTPTITPTNTPTSSATGTPSPAQTPAPMDIPRP